MKNINTEFFRIVELINMLLYNDQDYEATIKTAKAMIKNVGKDIQNHKDLEHIGVCHLVYAFQN